MKAVPKGVGVYRPRRMAEYTATCWLGPEVGADIEYMAKRFGWRVLGVNETPSKVGGNTRISMRILGRSRKVYVVRPGDWVIALGANGSIRVESSAEKFYETYERADK